MPQRVPQIAGEKVAAHPFREPPGDRQDDQAGVSTANAGPALDSVARYAGYEPRIETEKRRKARHDRWADQGKIGRRDIEGLEDPIRAHRAMAKTPGPTAQQGAARPR